MGQIKNIKLHIVTDIKLKKERKREKIKIFSMGEDNTNTTTSNKSIYKEIFFMWLGGAITSVIAYLFWVPDIQSLTDELSAHIVRSWFLHIYLPAVFFFFPLVQFTSNFGHVDKVWSIVPTVCCWYVTFLDYQWSGFKHINTKYVVMCCLVTLWMIKMVIGLWRRGGIDFPCVWRGHEDYRWEVVRGKAPYVFTNPFISTFVNLF